MPIAGVLAGVLKLETGLSWLKSKDIENLTSILAWVFQMDMEEQKKPFLSPVSGQVGHRIMPWMFQFKCRELCWVLLLSWVTLGFEPPGYGRKMTYIY